MPIAIRKSEFASVLSAVSQLTAENTKLRGCRQLSSRWFFSFRPCWHGCDLRALSPTLRRSLGLGSRLRRNQSQCLPYLVFEVCSHVLIVFQELTGILTALSNTLALVAEPRSGLLKNVLVHGNIQQIGFLRNPFPINNVKLGLAEWSRDFVLDYLYLRTRTSNNIAVLDRGNTANIGADGCVEFQGAATGCRFGIAEHDPDFFADLVDKDQAGPRLRNCSGKLAERLRHQPCLQTHVAVAHFAIEFGLGDKRGDGIDDQHINCT